MKKLSEWIYKICVLMLISITLATVFGFFGARSWLLDLFSHFRVQYFQLCLAVILITLWQRKYRAAVIAIAVACLNYAFVLPYYFGKPAPVNTPVARAMLINLNASNGSAEAVLETVTAAAPDILLLLEVTPDQNEKNARLNAQFSYRIGEPQSGFLGILLLSKYPLSHEKIIYSGNAGIPTVVANIHLPRGEVAVIGTHLPPPLGAKLSVLRDWLLVQLAHLAAAQKTPVLLIGDLNITPWSPHFSNLLKTGGLKNSMRGFGFQPTWPAPVPFIKIPLDHALHSPEIKIQTRQIGLPAGSDHFPLIVDFSL
ncbi:MAG: endonuclease/exonuclease/phosphatase family protein [Kiritimatiellales bacterium]